MPEYNSGTGGYADIQPQYQPNGTERPQNDCAAGSADIQTCRYPEKSILIVAHLYLKVFCQRFHNFILREKFLTDYF